MKKYFSVVMSLMSLAVSAQTIDYNFNDCSLNDASGQFAPATTVSTPECVCGLIENGLYFDGNLDNVVFDENIDSTFQEDFTIIFYFKLEDASTNIDIISIKNSCDLDSIFDMVYRPASNKLQIQIGNNLSSLEAREIVIDPTRCWHRFALTKSGLVYTWYINDVREEYVAPSNVQFGKGASIALANSPCLGNGSVERFKGWIDEFKIYPRALSAVELKANDLLPDQIITRDTTIVLGATVNIETGPTCATSFSWEPAESIDDPSLLNIATSPEETTQYSISFANVGGCIAQDTMTVFVIDEDALDCEQLLLPNAFTPNGDQLNDTYGISNLFLLEEIIFFEIYDRWGAKIWQTTDKNDAWDGTNGSSPVNPGMYIYKIKYICSGDEYVKLDNFSVLR